MSSLLDNTTGFGFPRTKLTVIVPMRTARTKSDIPTPSPTINWKLAPSKKKKNDEQS